MLGDNVVMNLTNNNFKNNSAFIGGAGIYFNNKLFSESPYQQNNFVDNKASFANDFLTFPMRLKITDSTYLRSLSSLTDKTYSLSIVPGITETSLYFDVVDYYGQTVKSLNGGFIFLIILFDIYNQFLDIPPCN